MMKILRIVSTLNLPDWWIGAGFVRGKVWDTLHGYTQRTYLPDVDVVYFNENDFTKLEASKETTKIEQVYERELTKQVPDINWSVTNQARMHLFHGDNPYHNSEEAISHWVETATCIGVRLSNERKIVLCTPRGIDDLVNLRLRPTPDYKNTITFTERAEKKKWLLKWPMLKIVSESDCSD